MAHGTIKIEQIDTAGAGNIATDIEVAQMVSSSFVNPGHSGLLGLENDDHGQYLLANGSREVSSNFTVVGNIECNGSFWSTEGIGCDGDIWSVKGIGTDGDIWAKGNIGCNGIIWATESIGTDGNIWSGGEIGCNGNAIFNGYVRTEVDFYADNENGRGLVVKDKTTGILYKIIVDRGKVTCEKVV